MSEENSAGASYLAALKKTTGPQTAAAAPARTPGARASNYAASEKRKSPRYKCEGSVRIQQAGSSLTTWAAFTDISMSGCYVEAAATYQVGILLNLKLDAKGFRIETTGEVRASYPQLGMGLCFTRISAEDREQLRGLLRALGAASVIVSTHGTPRERPLSPSAILPPATDPAATLRAMSSFFEDRHVMGREEFLMILRKGVNPLKTSVEPQK